MKNTPGAFCMGAIRKFTGISGTGPIFPERTHSLNDLSFNNGSKGYLYKIKKVVMSVSTQLNVIIGGKYACLE